MTPSDCEVLIVGGGPAGSTCAWKLQQQGRNVLVVDKATFPRDKVCAGWITPEVVGMLELDVADYANANVLQPITGFRVGIVGGGAQFINYDSIVSYGIRRREFDHYLLKRCGANVQDNTAVSSIERESGGWVVNRSIRAKMLVGAGGQFCPIGRWLLQQGDGSQRSVADHVVAAQEVEFAMSASERDACAIDPCVPELYFYPDLTGYAWCFRKGDVLNIGLGRIGEQHLRKYRDELLASLVNTGRIGQLPAQRFRGHAYRLNCGQPTPLVADRVLLIGDAAGLADAKSGEGIRPAIQSGLLAASVIGKADRSFDRSQLTAYQEAIEGISPVASSSQLWMLPRRLLGKWLMNQRWFVKNVILDRWFLNRRAVSTKASSTGLI